MTPDELVERWDNQQAADIADGKGDSRRFSTRSELATGGHRPIGDLQDDERADHVTRSDCSARATTAVPSRLVRTLAIPSPEKMRPRWASYAAVSAARGSRWAEGCYARGATWHFDDGGGNWADLRWHSRSEAVLIGYDHEYSETYFDAAADYFDRSETDLFAGVPSWWRHAASGYIERQRRTGEWIGFVYGFDGYRWSRADYTEPDGFDALGLPFSSDATCSRRIADLLNSWKPHDRATSHTVASLLYRGHTLDRSTADSVFGARRLDVDAAVAAANAFTPLPRGDH